MYGISIDQVFDLQDRIYKRAAELFVLQDNNFNSEDTEDIKAVRQLLMGWKVESIGTGDGTDSIENWVTVESWTSLKFEHGQSVRSNQVHFRLEEVLN